MHHGVQVIGELVRRTGAGAVYCHTEVRSSGRDPDQWALPEASLCSPHLHESCSNIHISARWQASHGSIAPRLGEQQAAPPPAVVSMQVTFEERRVEAAVKAAAEGAGAQLRAFWGATLAHLEDLPFKLDQLPQSFGGWLCWERVLAGCAGQLCGGSSGLPTLSDCD